MVLPHYLLRVGGTLFGGPQSWSIGIRFRSQTNGDPGTGSNALDKLNDWRDAVRALNETNVFPDAILNNVGSATRITYVRAATIGTDGREAEVAIVEGTPLAIGTSGAIHPAQTAVTMSLMTGRPGPSYRGRVYLPGLAIPIQPNGMIEQARCASMSAAFGQWIADVGNAGADILNPQLLPVVVSTTKNVATPITLCRMGNRLDIQRRRGDKQQETYSVAPVPD